MWSIDTLKIFNSTIYFLGYMRGLTKIWFIGDEFGNNNFNIFKEMKKSDNKPDSFCYENFEVRPFFSSKFSSSNPSVICRIRNNLVKALNEHNTLPKAIIIVLDDDIIKSIPTHSKNKVKIDFSVSARHSLSWLARELHKLLDIYKSWLPCKAKTSSYPHFVWITPPNHSLFTEEDNARHDKFARCLMQSTSIYDEMSCLKMLKIWDQENESLFVEEAYRFTALGIETYWKSVDSAVKYWNTAIASKIDRSQHKSNNYSNMNQQVPAYNKYHWFNNKKRDHQRNGCDDSYEFNRR